MHLNKSTGVLIILALLVLGAAAYLMFGTDGAPGVTGETPAATGAEQTFLSLAARIDPVEFDTGILEDPRFTALVDIRTAITAESSGRIDPFAPLGR